MKRFAFQKQEIIPLQSATNPAEFLVQPPIREQPRIPLAAIPHSCSAAKQDCISNSSQSTARRPFSYQGGDMPPHLKWPRAILDVDCASSIHRRTSSRLDPALGPAHNAVMGGRHGRRRPKTRILLYSSHAHCQPSPELLPAPSYTKSDFRFQRWSVVQGGISLSSILCSPRCLQIAWQEKPFP